MVRIDQALCIGCAKCQEICPRGITMVEGKARVVDQQAECLEEASAVCPCRAILLAEEKVASQATKPRSSGLFSGPGSGRGGGRGMGRGLGNGSGSGRGVRGGRRGGKW